jgi:hypothetical protein
MNCSTERHSKAFYGGGILLAPLKWGSECGKYGQREKPTRLLRCAMFAFKRVAIMFCLS